MNKLEFIKNRLTNKIEEAKKLREKIAAEILKGDGEAVYQIRWLQEKTMVMITAQYAEAMLQMLSEGKSIEEVNAWVKTEKDRWYPEQSSSPFSNAVALEKFEALRRLSDNWF